MLTTHTSLPHAWLFPVPLPARHIPTGQIVALKKVRFDRGREGLPVTSARELAILQAARHPNIVQLLRVVTGHRPDR
jgi:serine/threonine protein kinase